MKKSIAIKEGGRIKKYRLGKVSLPLTVVNKHLYPSDDRFFHRDVESDNNLLFLDVESVQPYGDGSMQYDPDVGIALMDTDASGGKKNVGYLPMIVNNPMVLVYGAVAVVIIASVFGVKL